MPQVFWKPIPSSQIDPNNGRVYKKLGSGAYVLWARCDYCTGSGPYEKMNAIVHRMQELEGLICDECAHSTSIWSSLYQEGWRRA